MSEQHTFVMLADDLTWDQFLVRLQPLPVKGGAAVITPERRRVDMVLRRFADGDAHLIGTEPIADRWYYRVEP